MSRSYRCGSPRATPSFCSFTPSEVCWTFQAIITDQFERLREGDRFWWQNESFDAQTQQIISNTTLSTIINRDTDTNALQQNAFVATERHASDVAATDPAKHDVARRCGMCGNDEEREERSRKKVAKRHALANVAQNGPISG